MTTATKPRGRSALFAYNPQAVAAFILAKGVKLPPYERASVSRYANPETKTATRPGVLRVLDKAGLTERQFKDWCKRNSITAVLWDRTNDER